MRITNPTGDEAGFSHAALVSETTGGTRTLVEESYGCK